MKTNIITIIGTNDKINISNSHLGDSDFFIKFAISKEKIEKIEEIKNTFKDMDENKHASDRKKQSVFSLFGKIDMVIAGEKSPNFKKINEETTIMTATAKGQIEDILNTIKENFDDYYNHIKERQNKLKKETIAIT